MNYIVCFSLILKTCQCTAGKKFDGFEKIHSGKNTLILTCFAGII